MKLSLLPYLGNCKQLLFSSTISRTLLSLSFFIFLSSSAFATCNCSNGLIDNGDFEVSTAGWINPSATNASFYVGTGFQQCGTAQNAFLQHNLGIAKTYYQISGIPAGINLDLTFYAGTHRPDFDHRVRIIFYDSNNNQLSIASQQIDFDVDGQGGALQLYTINTTPPAGTDYARVELYATGDFIIIDEVCLKSSTNYSCNLVNDTFTNCNVLFVDGDVSLNDTYNTLFPPGEFTVVTDPNIGTLDFNPDGTFNYTTTQYLDDSFIYGLCIIRYKSEYLRKIAKK